MGVCQPGESRPRLKWTAETVSNLKEVKIPPCREKVPVTSATWNSRATAAGVVVFHYA